MIVNTSFELAQWKAFHSDDRVASPALELYGRAVWEALRTGIERREKVFLFTM